MEYRQNFAFYLSEFTRPVQLSGLNRFVACKIACEGAFDRGSGFAQLSLWRKSGADLADVSKYCPTRWSISKEIVCGGLIFELLQSLTFDSSDHLNMVDSENLGGT